MGFLLYIATGQIDGWVDRASRIDEEIDNLCRSELGGAPGDYVAVEAPTRRPGQTWEIQADLAVLVADPSMAMWAAAKTSGRDKLFTLGLTLEEIDAL